MGKTVSVLNVYIEKLKIHNSNAGKFVWILSQTASKSLL